MQEIYIVIENGVLYTDAFTHYKSAINEVKKKHKRYIEEYIKDVGDLEVIETALAEINVPENTKTGISYLYIEKGINIEIHKIPIKN